MESTPRSSNSTNNVAALRVSSFVVEDSASTGSGAGRGSAAELIEDTTADFASPTSSRVAFLVPANAVEEAAEAERKSRTASQEPTSAFEHGENGSTAAQQTEGSLAPPASSAASSTLRAKIGYFCLYAAFGASSPYYSLMFRKIGFSKVAVGALAACMPLCTLTLLTPLAYAADRYNCAFQILGTSFVVTSLTLLFITTKAFSTNLIIVAICIIVHYIFRTPLGPFFDYRSMAALPAHRKSEWGTLRSYGAYGWGLGAPFASFLIGYTGWWLSAVLFICWITAGLYCYVTLTPCEVRKPTTMNYGQVLRYVSTHKRLLVFLLAVCCMGTGYSLIETFLFLFLDELHAPSALLGISVMVTVVVEIPLFQQSKHLHARFTDRQLLLASMVSWSVRVTGYSLLQNPWVVLVLEPLHGFTFGLMWLSGVHFIQNAFPKSLAASSMGFLSASAFGFGPLIGNLVGGILYNMLGARWMFRCAAAAMLVLSVVYFTCDRYYERLGYHCDAVEEEEQGGEKQGEGRGRSHTKLEKEHYESDPYEDARLYDSPAVV